MTTEERDAPLPVLLAACGQERALRWWPELTPFLLAAKDRLATSPDGHGGVLHALSAGGHLADLARRGIQYLF